jgi:hypothetical protein
MSKLVGVNLAVRRRLIPNYQNYNPNISTRPASADLWHLYPEELLLIYIFTLGFI